MPFSGNKWSFAGFLTAFTALSQLATAPGVIYLIGSSLWTIEAVFSFWVIRDVSRAGRKPHGSMAHRPQATHTHTHVCLTGVGLLARMFTQVWYFFRGKGGVEQAKQQAALAAFKAGLSGGSSRV